VNPPKDPILAAILSLLIPGLGQFYCRQWGRGALFLVGTIFTGALFPPLGFLLSAGIWIWGIVDAYRIAQAEQGYEGRSEGPIIDVGRPRFSRIDIRPALTLVGIPVAIVFVIVLILAVVLTRYGFWRDGSSKEIGKSLIEKIEAHKTKTGSYPRSLNVLIDPTDPIEKKQTLDLYGNPYIYRTTQGGFELLSSGKDARPDTKDDIRYTP